MVKNQNPFGRNLYKTNIWKILTNDVLFFLFKSYYAPPTGSMGVILRFRDSETLSSYDFITVADGYRKPNRSFYGEFNFPIEPLLYLGHDSTLNNTENSDSQFFYSFFLCPRWDSKKIVPELLTRILKQKKFPEITLSVLNGRISLVCKIRENEKTSRVQLYSALDILHISTSAVFSENSQFLKKRFCYRNSLFKKENFYRTIVKTDVVKNRIITLVLCCWRTTKFRLSTEILECIFFNLDSIFIICEEIAQLKKLDQLTSEIMTNIKRPGRKLSENAQRLRKIYENL